jgi:hypothetical protein
MFIRILFPFILLFTSVVAQEPGAKPDLKRSSAEWEIHLQKMRKELETQPPKIRIAVFIDNKRIDAANFSFELFDGQKLLSPKSADGSVLTYDRSPNEPSLYVSAANDDIFIDKPYYNLFHTGADVIIQFVHNIKLLEKDICTPETHDDLQEFFYTSRAALKHRWTSTPDKIRSKTHSIVSISISPRTIDTPVYEPLDIFRETK